MSRVHRRLHRLRKQTCAGARVYAWAGPRRAGFKPMLGSQQTRHGGEIRLSLSQMSAWSRKSLHLLQGLRGPSLVSSPSYHKSQSLPTSKHVMSVQFEFFPFSEWLCGYGPFSSLSYCSCLSCVCSGAHPRGDLRSSVLAPSFVATLSRLLPAEWRRWWS